MRTTPTLRYFVSETYGENTPDPTEAVVDADVHLETDLSVMEDALTHGDEEEIRLLGGGFPTKINSRGREVALPRHLAGIMENWHDAYAEVLRDHGVWNGLFINFAPRDKRYRNGPPFYEVETDSGLRIVTTFPGDMLAGIREHVHRIMEIPNERNPLFSDFDQFRSRNAHRYLRRNHRYPTKPLADGEADDVLSTTYFGNGVEGLRLKFVDIYGNMIFEDDAAVRRKLQQVAVSGERGATVSVSNGTVKQSKQGEVAHSLTEGTDGAILVYPNGRNIDVVRKWREGESSTFTTENSAYKLLGSPEELHSGLHIRFHDGTSSEELRILAENLLVTS